MSIYIPGTYANGFAPRDFEPRYPSLWQGCVGAWAPCLGPTGVTLRDWSGRQNHGAITSADTSTFWAPSSGQYGNFYDGTDDYTDCGRSTLFDLTTNYTLSAWVNTSSVTGYRVIMAKRLSSPNVNYQFYLTGVGGSAGKLAFYNSAGGVEKVSTYLATVGQWFHAAAVVSGGTNLTIYANGISVLSTTITTGVANAGMLAFGRDGDQAAEFFIGGLDDLRIYSRILLPNEITLLASRRGVAYEPRVSRRFSGSAASRLLLLRRRFALA